MHAGLLEQVRFSAITLAIAIALAILLNVTGARQAHGGNFEPEARRIWTLVQQACAQRLQIYPKDQLSGAMVRCNSGNASLIATSDLVSDNLASVRIVWNDASSPAVAPRHRHANKAEAEFFVRAALRLYAAPLEDEVSDHFGSDTSFTWQVDGIEIDYSVYKAVLITERTLTIRPSMGTAKTAPADPALSALVDAVEG
jgi:hypothetical protein